MNKQLVSSLVEVVLNLSPENQKLFESQLHARQSEEGSPNDLAPIEKAEQFRQWVDCFPKSDISLPAEALHRGSIYDDRRV
ncbi:hypothetical protein [Altericista sp. CCNU0014]|uniref:hypothetical protein n=1 Tax=Altericista sp. CCNU0014 TaxID=3082949 RepID=UPI00384AEF92